jgi:hypothetical protein
MPLLQHTIVIEDGSGEEYSKIGSVKYEDAVASGSPARDFGPRLVAVLAGYGTVAIPGPQNGFWIYIVGPMLGAVAGAWLYERLIGPILPRKRPAGVEEAAQERPLGG